MSFLKLSGPWAMTKWKFGSKSMSSNPKDVAKPNFSKMTQQMIVSEGLVINSSHTIFKVSSPDEVRRYTDLLV